MNVVRHPEWQKGSEPDDLAVAVTRVLEGASADGKISVPRGCEYAKKGAPLGRASNFNKTSGADAPGGVGEEGAAPRAPTPKRAKAAKAAAKPPVRRDANGKKVRRRPPAPPLRKPPPPAPKAAKPPDPAAEQRWSSVAWQLAGSLRDLMGRSQQKCRLWLVAPSATLVAFRPGDGKRSPRFAVEGMSTCKSCNCPLCVRQWERVRTREVQTAVANWLRKDLPVIFGTFLMRHHHGMPLALEMRLLNAAFGNLWSGNAGKKLAALIGGKPESIKAHDLTWSERGWWHPHLHALFFHAEELNVTVDELEEALRARWLKALPQALKSMKSLVARILGADERRPFGSDPCRVHQRFLRHIEKKRARRCWRGHGLMKRLRERRAIEGPGPEIEEHHQCSDCAFELGQREAHHRKRGQPMILEPGDRVLHEEWRGETCSACMFGTGECPNSRERAARMFGKSLVPDHVPLRESMLRLKRMLKLFTAKNISPDSKRCVQLDRIHRGDPFDQVSSYLPKLGAMGFELASASSKLGRERRDRKGRIIRHYSKWEVAHLTTMRHEPRLRGAARRAWRQLYRATKGLAHISFSDRLLLGVGLDPYANDNEPPEFDIDENEQRFVVGEIEKPTWVGMAREHGHALLAALSQAFHMGKLETLSWVQPPKHGSDEPVFVLDPAERAPPEVSQGLDAARAAEARARWRAQRDRTIYEAEKVDRSRRWEKLRAVAAVAGPEAWQELRSAIQAEDRWIGSGADRGAAYWEQANAAHERREELRAGEGEREDMVSRARAELAPEGALYGVELDRRRRFEDDWSEPEAPGKPKLTPRQHRRRIRNELIARIETARTLRRTGLDRLTADRMAREMYLQEVSDEWIEANRLEALALLRGDT